MKGATALSSAVNGAKHISTHAPMKGATLYCFIPQIYRDNFNSRSHEGSDAVISYWTFQRINFNSRSHEGSDVVFDGICNIFDNFNSRSHEGSDNAVDVAAIFLELFQLTLP